MVKTVSKCPKLMDIVHRLLLISAHVQFQVKFVHIPGKLNPIADALSRLQVEKFRKLAPNAEDTPVSLPQVIWLDLEPKWKYTKMQLWHLSQDGFIRLAYITTTTFVKHWILNHFQCHSKASSFSQHILQDL